MRLLLHACCGPCSLEPIRLLRAAGREPVVFYANSNIHPAEEYRHRLSTLRSWAESEDVSVIEGMYDPSAWEEAVRGAGATSPIRCLPSTSEGSPTSSTDRKDRCRACYRLRFREAAAYAAANGYDTLGTTLSVSPYQFTDVIREELEDAAREAGVQALFEDYRPYYDEATRRSRKGSMYRQNYCGCRFSKVEAADERAVRKRQRDEERAAQRADQAQERAVQEAMRAAKQEERRAYAAKQAQKHAILKALRERKGE